MVGSPNSQTVSFWHGVGCGNRNYGLHIYRVPDAVLVTLLSHSILLTVLKGRVDLPRVIGEHGGSEE